MVSLGHSAPQGEWLQYLESDYEALWMLVAILIAERRAAETVIQDTMLTLVEVMKLSHN